MPGGCQRLCATTRDCVRPLRTAHCSPFAVRHWFASNSRAAETVARCLVASVPRNWQAANCQLQVQPASATAPDWQPRTEKRGTWALGQRSIWSAQLGTVATRRLIRAQLARRPQSAPPSNAAQSANQSRPLRPAPETVSTVSNSNSNATLAHSHSLPMHVGCLSAADNLHMQSVSASRLRRNACEWAACEWAARQSPFTLLAPRSALGASLCRSPTQREPNEAPGPPA